MRSKVTDSMDTDEGQDVLSQNYGILTLDKITEEGTALASSTNPP